MYVIGIDPHRGSHAVAVLDGEERVRAELHLAADRQQRQRLAEWAREFAPRLWAIEGSTGTGALLAQQLVATGEVVVDVPPKLAAPVRVLDNNHSDKTDTHDARSAAIVALRNSQLRQIGLEDHPRCVAPVRQAPPRSHHRPHPGDLPAAHHRVLPDRRSPALTAEGRTGSRGSHPTTTIDVEPKALAGDLLAEVRRLDPELHDHSIRTQQAVETSASTITQLYGVGPIVGAYILGYRGDVARFPSAGHYARYNATAPIEASRGRVVRHRLNPRGNRQLNHAVHMIAVTQVRNDTPGRVYYLRKQAEGHSRTEAMRALKRRISDAVYRQLLADARG
jgi:transposase